MMVIHVPYGLLQTYSVEGKESARSSVDICLNKAACSSDCTSEFPSDLFNFP